MQLSLSPYHIIQINRNFQRNRKKTSAQGRANRSLNPACSVITPNFGPDSRWGLSDTLISVTASRSNELLPEKCVYHFGVELLMLFSCGGGRGRLKCTDYRLSAQSVVEVAQRVWQLLRWEERGGVIYWKPLLLHSVLSPPPARAQWIGELWPRQRAHNRHSISRSSGSSSINPNHQHHY